MGFGLGGVDHHEAVGLGIREGAKHYGVHEAEDGGIGADAEGERDPGGRGDAGVATQHPKSVFQILKHEISKQSVDRSRVRGRL